MQDQSELQPNTAKNTLNAIKRPKKIRKDKKEYFEEKANEAEEAEKGPTRGKFQNFKRTVWGIKQRKLHH